MSLDLSTARALAAVTLWGAASAALAQVTLPPPQAMATYTLVSPPLQQGQNYQCTVTNVSSLPVTLTRLQIYEQGTTSSAPCAGVGATLSPGSSCKASYSPANPAQAQPHCRAKFLATKSGAVTGSLHASDGSGSSTTYIALPLQLVEGVALVADGY
jgi:hypothetical protein